MGVQEAWEGHDCETKTESYPVPWSQESATTSSRELGMDRARRDVTSDGAAAPKRVRQGPWVTRAIPSLGFAALIHWAMDFQTQGPAEPTAALPAIPAQAKTGFPVLALHLQVQEPSSPLQLDGALSTDRLRGDRLAEVEDEDAVGVGETSAGILPKGVRLRLLALPEVQGLLKGDRELSVAHGCGCLAGYVCGSSGHLPQPSGTKSLQRRPHSNLGFSPSFQSSW